MMMCQGMNTLVRFCQFPEITVDVVWMTAFGFQLNGHVCDAWYGSVLAVITNDLRLSVSQIGA